MHELCTGSTSAGCLRPAIFFVSCCCIFLQTEGNQKDWDLGKYVFDFKSPINFSFDYVFIFIQKYKLLETYLIPEGSEGDGQSIRP